MSIIIRLQNLPWTANSLDIRRFFHGLSIPDGGVHIVGGSKGDAFIAFASDDDARQAMSRDGLKIKDATVKLMLSSRNEMQSVIDLARSQSLALKAAAKPAGGPGAVAPAGRPGPPPLQKNGNPDMDNYDRNNAAPPANRMRERSRSPIQRAPMSGVVNIGGDGPRNGQPWNRQNNNHPNSFQQRPPPPLGQPQHLTPSALQSGDRIANVPPNLIINGRPPLHQTGGIGIGGGLENGNIRAEMRGLPFSVTVRDIQEFLKTANLYLPEESVKILVDERGLKTGGALIRLASNNELDLALSTNGRFMGDRRIDVTPLLDGPPAPPNMMPLPLHDGPVDSLPQRDYVVYMKGIPFNSCTNQDVQNFFHGLRITDLVFEVDGRTGKPAGNAYVEFGSKEDYDGALALHMRHMGRRYIEVFPTTRDDLNEAKAKASGKMGGEMRRTFCISVTGLPPSVNNHDLTSYLQEVNALPFAIHIMLKAQGVNAGEAFIEFLDPDHQMRALRRDGDVIASHQISVRSVDYEVMAQIVGKPIGPSFGGGPHGGHPQRPPFRPHHNERPMFEERGRRRSPVQQQQQRRPINGNPFSDPSTVVIVSNIPYKATNEDLDEFFAGFSMVQGGIERRQNDRGQFTPEARVAFTSPMEADAAVKQMHKKTLLGRPLFLRHAI